MKDFIVDSTSCRWRLATATGIVIELAPNLREYVLAKDSTREDGYSV